MNPEEVRPHPAFSRAGAESSGIAIRPDVVGLCLFFFRFWMRTRLEAVQARFEGAGDPVLQKEQPVLLIANLVIWWDGFLLAEFQRAAVLPAWFHQQMGSILRPLLELPLAFRPVRQELLLEARLFQAELLESQEFLSLELRESLVLLPSAPLRPSPRS